MDQSIAAQSPLGRKCQVETILAQIQDMPLGSVFFQLIRYNGDHFSPGSQTAVLRRPIGPSGIAGHQYIALPGGLAAHFFGEGQIIRRQLPAAHQGHRRLLQQLQLAAAPQATRRIQPQAVMDCLGVLLSHTADRMASQPLSPPQIMFQQNSIIQQSNNPLRHLQRIAQCRQIPAFQLSL